MSVGRFLTQLSHTISYRCFFVNPSFSSLPCRRFFFSKWRATQLYRPYSFTAKFSTFSTSLTPSETPPTRDIPIRAITNAYISPYLSVDIRCQKDVADELSDALLCFGASSVTLDENDADDNVGEVCISSIFTEDRDVKLCISNAADSIGMTKIPSYVIKMGEQYDWVKKTQESFQPVEVTEGVWIVPEWTAPPDLQATNIILNPGLAFGTGEHATTMLCLLLLHSLIRGGELFLDYGTGSGILAIAALKFGAASSVGIDVDPQAIASARQNAVLNNVDPEKMQLHLVPSNDDSHLMESCKDVEEHSSYGEEIEETEKYDIVIANILLNPLLDLAENIISYVKPGGVVGLSGILSEQVPYMMGRYSNFLEDISVSEMDNWACLRGTKKRNAGDISL